MSDMVRALGGAFGLDPDKFRALVDAYESPGITLPETADRLALIEARHVEAGCGDADKGWLIAEVKRLRAQVNGARNCMERIEAIIEARP